jgi:integrase
MARVVKNPKLDTRTARKELSARKAPYWTPITRGCALGYRKGAKGGAWVAKIVRDGLRRETRIGPADDVVDVDEQLAAEGSLALSHAQAQEEARKWFAKVAREEAGDATADSFTVRDAVEEYLQDYKRRSGKALDRITYNIDAHILPALGDVQVSKLSKKEIDKWRHSIAESPGRRRTRRGEAQKYRDLPADDPEARRRRKHTANKILTILKAALNYAHDQHGFPNSDAWKEVKAFRDVDVPKVRYLTDDESRRLVNACPPDLRAMVTAALLTGARYSELARLRSGDFNADVGTIYVAESKNGKDHHIALTDEGHRFFTDTTAGQVGTELIFRKTGGGPWKHTHQYRPLKAACATAKIIPAIGFHILRHTYGSRLAMRDVPMAVIAKQLGHTNTRTTERHYAHLSKGYVAETVRAAFDNIGIVQESNVATLSARA